MGELYSKQDDALILTCFEALGPDWLTQQLGRNRDSILYRARKLGFLQQEQWQPWELATLVQQYRFQGAVPLVPVLDREKSAIHTMASRLGIKYVAGKDRPPTLVCEDAVSCGKFEMKARQLVVEVAQQVQDAFDRHPNNWFATQRDLGKNRFRYLVRVCQDYCLGGGKECPFRYRENGREVWHLTDDVAAVCYRQRRVEFVLMNRLDDHLGECRWAEDALLLGIEATSAMHRQVVVWTAAKLQEWIEGGKEKAVVSILALNSRQWDLLLKVTYPGSHRVEYRAFEVKTGLRYKPQGIVTQLRRYAAADDCRPLQLGVVIPSRVRQPLVGWPEDILVLTYRQLGIAPDLAYRFQGRGR